MWLCHLRFLGITVYLHKSHQVIFLNSKKVDKSNKKLLELRMRSVEEQNKQQKTDRENTEKKLETHTVKSMVRWWKVFNLNPRYAKRWHHALHSG